MKVTLQFNKYTYLNVSSLCIIYIIECGCYVYDKPTQVNWHEINNKNEHPEYWGAKFCN